MVASGVGSWYVVYDERQDGFPWTCTFERMSLAGDESRHGQSFVGSRDALFLIFFTLSRTRSDASLYLFTFPSLLLFLWLYRIAYAHTHTSIRKQVSTIYNS